MQRHVGGAWADDAAAALLARLAHRPAMRMCLATGSTPMPLYERLARSPDAFASAAVLLLDEFGGVPIGDPARCDAVLREALVEHVCPADYRSIDVDAVDLAAECTAVDAWIEDGGIDLAVLGLGVNGHVGMNEPGSSADGRTARVALAPDTVAGARRYFADRAAPNWGVTVGLGDLLAAREVWVLATGLAKAAIVERCWHDCPSVDVPASLLQRHPDCTWWLDEPAAG